MNHELRPVEAGDAAFLYGLYADTRHGEFAGAGWDPARLEAFLRSQFELRTNAYRRMFPDTDARIILCDGTPVGWVMIARPPGEIRLVDIALLGAWRGRGIGTRLLAGLLAEASAAGVAVRCHVEAGNRARNLYGRLGFRVVGENGPYFLMERAVG